MEPNVRTSDTDPGADEHPFPDFDPQPDAHENSKSHPDFYKYSDERPSDAYGYGRYSDRHFGDTDGWRDVYWYGR